MKHLREFHFEEAYLAIAIAIGRSDLIPVLLVCRPFSAQASARQRR